MSSTTLENEIKIYNNLVKQNELALFKLSQFFKNMSKNGLSFIDKTKKSLDDYFIELKKENSSATHIICLTNFYNGLIKYFDKLKEMFQNIDTQCGVKISTFSNSLKNNFTEPINGLSKIETKLNEQKSNLEKIKNDYFNVNKNVVELESKINQLKESKTKKEEEIKKNNDTLKNSQKTLEINRNKYFVEINKYNKNLALLEKDYIKEIDKINLEQEKKIKYIYELLNDFKKEINNLGQSNLEFVNLMEKLNKSTNIIRDVDLFKDEYNFCSDDKKRFLNEEFLDYEVYKKNNEESKILTLKKDKKSNSFNLKMFGIGKKDDESKTQVKRITDLIPKLFYDDEKLNDDDTSFLMNYVEKEKESNLTFINILMNNFKKNEFIKVNNIFNFNLLASLVQLIIDKNSNNIEELYNEYIFIIKLSENMIYDDKDNISLKNYLCQKIYKLNIFSKKQFWSFLINNKIKNFTEEKTRQEIEKKEKGKNLRGNKLGQNNNNTYYSKFKGMFNFNNDNNNKKLENEIVLGLKYKDNLPLCCVEVIEEFIQHFSNFNLSQIKSKEIVKEIYDKYKFDKIYYKYFMSEINSNTYSSKLQIEIFQNNRQKMDYKKLNLNIKNKDFVSSNPTINALIYSVNYLDIDDYKNIMTLNKECYYKIKKAIYTKILLKYPNINVEKKIKIWKIILNNRENRIKYNYNQIKNIIMNKPTNNNGRDIIDLDVVRTAFKENKEINQKKISYILKSIVEIIPGIQYNQGMNYIAAFLLNITQDEEESFYLFYGLMTSTEYGELFKNDLAKLKKFFYIFERLISIFLPELYNYFIDNNIKVSFFMSSWFITLFTNAYQYINIKNNPQILLKIWDLFFYEDWKSIIITSISLLKCYETKILVFTTEELLHFLISDIIKESYFENDNYDKYMYNMFNFKIDDELINKIEKEIEIKKEMPNLGKNLNFQII